MLSTVALLMKHMWMANDLVYQGKEKLVGEAAYTFDAGK